jgi:hypothetical protein
VLTLCPYRSVNIGAKYFYVTQLRGTRLLTSGWVSSRPAPGQSCQNAYTAITCHLRGWKAQFIWIGIICGMWILGFIFAELIPVSFPTPPLDLSNAKTDIHHLQFFNQLLTIISSLVSTWSAYGVPGIIWFFMRKPQVKADGWRRAYFGSLLTTFFFFCSSISVSRDHARQQSSLVCITADASFRAVR